MTTREEWYKPNLLYNIHYRPPQKNEPRLMVVTGTKSTCGRPECELHYRMEKKVVWVNQEMKKVEKKRRKAEVMMRWNEALERNRRVDFEAIEDALIPSMSRRVTRFRRQVAIAREEYVQECKAYGRNDVDESMYAPMSLVAEPGKPSLFCEKQGSRDITNESLTNEKPVNYIPLTVEDDGIGGILGIYCESGIHASYEIKTNSTADVDLYAKYRFRYTGD